VSRTVAAREKVRPLDDLARTLESRRPALRVALTNGCFDLLHVGHVRSLEFAAAQADILVVGVNDDASVHSIKTPDRPIVSAPERAELIAALDCVDYVVVFGERTAERLVAALKPDVYVKGGDYTEASLPEAAVVRAYGGEIVLAPLVTGISTTSIIDRIRRTT
jgi:rfaE bifunctional protein nucleotidyltransferase chain/domain